jgi:hypothetical protein
MTRTGTIQATSEEPVCLCDFGDMTLCMTPHTLVGGAQTTLSSSRQRPARAGVVETAQVRLSEAWEPRHKTHTPPLDALDRRAGGTGAIGMGRNIPLYSLKEYRVGKGLTLVVSNYAWRNHVF